MARKLYFLVDRCAFERGGYHGDALTRFKRQNRIDVAVQIVVNAAHRTVRVCVDKTGKGIRAAAVNDLFALIRGKISSERGDPSVLKAHIARRDAVAPDGVNILK